MKNEPMRSDCPSNETMAALVDGQLSPRERSEVLRHMTTCENDCHDLFLAVSAAKREAGEGSVVAFPKRSRGPVVWGSVAAAVAAIVAAFLVPQLRDRLPFMPKHGIAALIAASGPTRNTESRLSGFPYQERAQVMRGEQRSKNYRLLAAVGEIEDEASTNRSAQNLHALGVAHFLVRDWDSAVRELEEALRKETGRNDTNGAVQSSTDVALLNDLSAAYASRAQEKDQMPDFLAAGECSQRAWLLSKTPTVAWNRAVAIEGTKARELTRRAWADYLQVETDPQWAAQGRKHSEGSAGEPDSELWRRLQPGLSEASDRGDDLAVAEVVRRLPQHSRSYAEDEALPEWGRALVDNDPPRANRSLDVARAVGKALRESSGEQMLADSVAVIDRAERAKSVTRLLSLANGHLRYGGGKTLLEQQRPAESIAALTSAHHELAAGGSPFASLCLVEIATNQFHRRDYAAVSDTLDSIERANRPAVHRYLFLSGRISWIHGLVALATGHAYESISSYRSAITAFHAGREGGNIAAVEGLLSEAYQFLGQWNEAAIHVCRAFDQSGHFGTSSRMRNHLYEAVNVALGRHEPNLALLFNDALVDVSRPVVDKSYLVNALTWRARTYRALGDSVAAERNLDGALAVTPRITDVEVRGRHRDVLALLRGITLADRKPNESVLLLDQVLHSAQAHGDHYTLAQVFCERARALAAAGNYEASETAFDLAVREIERQTGQLPSGDLRAGYLRSADEVFDRAIQSALDRGKVGPAFEYAERRRASSLRNLSDPRSLAYRPFRWEEVCRRLPADITLVEYVCESERLVIFVADRSGIRAWQHRITERDLTSEVDRTVNALQSGKRQDDVIGVSESLFQLLLRPQNISIRPRLLIVPDRVLWRVPFAALMDRETGQFLMQEHEIAVTPGAFFAMLHQQNDPSSASGSALIVSVDQSAEVGEFDLPHLPFARDEAQSVAAAWRMSAKSELTNCTKRVFMIEARTATLIHFVGHAVLSADRPALSCLLLGSNDRGSSEPLYAHEIARLGLRSPIVVLSACGSESESEKSRDGTSSLAAAFLAGGANAVIGTLWPIQDGTSRRLMWELHVRMAGGSTPAAALRYAQMTVFANSSTRHWAAYEVLTSAI